MLSQKLSRQENFRHQSLVLLIIWNIVSATCTKIQDSISTLPTLRNSSCESRIHHLDKLSTLLQSELNYLESKNEELNSIITNLMETCDCFQCLHEGHHYQNGDVWNPSSCITCSCQNGKVNCDDMSSTNGCTTESPCLKNLCLNGGSCYPSNSQGSFECACPSGFTGPLCELVVNKCMPSKREESCDFNEPVWFFDRSLQNCESPDKGCYDQASAFNSLESCSSTCMEGTCCYRRKSESSIDEYSEQVICQEETMSNCRSLCAEGEFDVVGFYPGTHCLGDTCRIQDPTVCHTGSTLLWPGSTFTIGCDECECQLDQISCRCNTMTVRKEIRDMSISERTRYKNAIAELQGNGSESIWMTFRNLYATFIMHSHSTSYYLFWHRLFLRTVERQLQEIDCSVSIPYFDFTIDASNLSLSSVWEDSYFGNVIDFSTDCTQPYGSLTLTSCRKRSFDFDVALPSMLETSIALTKTDFSEFTTYVQNIAGYVLSYIGDDLHSVDSMDPVFYSVHAYIDLLFWRWQQRHGYHSAEAFLNQDMNSNLIPFNTALKHTVNSEGSLCVSYWTPSSFDEQMFGTFRTRNSGYECSNLNNENERSSCQNNVNKALLDTGRRIQEILFTQTEDFLQTVPRTCPSLHDLPKSYVNQIWTKPTDDIRTSTNFQEIAPRSELCEKFCFTADVFLPDYTESDKNNENVKNFSPCARNEIAVCDISVLSSCPYYPHYPCKLLICGNCSAVCHVHGQELECGKSLNIKNPDFCNPNPCKNGGYCRPSKWPTLPHLVSCECMPSFMGEHCEEKVSQPCYLPMNSGNDQCGNVEKRWYFDVKNQECFPFVYNGCFGNANNFPSYYECRVSCMIGACCWRKQEHLNRAIGYSENGFDRYGFNTDGFSMQNEKQTHLNAFGGENAMYRFGGLDYQGYNEEGFNNKGIDRFGYTFKGHHHITKFNISGFNSFGDYDGIIAFQKDNYDSHGFNRAGLNCHGSTRDGWDYYHLAAGWTFDCRAMALRECQNTEKEYPYVDVISFSPGKKCEEVNCGKKCGCDFLGQSYDFESEILLGCNSCKCDRSGHVRCPCHVTYMRKEIRDLSRDELHRYQSAIKELHNEHFSSVWSNLTRLYAEYYPQSRGNDLFLPWHRFFLRLIEMKLQEIDCTITIPYYDWTMDSGSVENSIIWQSNYFGGNGKIEKDNCVPFHPFKAHEANNWIPCLRRNFNTSITFPDAVHIEMIRRETSYHKFRLKIEKISALFHLFVGGHMASPESAYDPIFLSHYAFVDKLWADWEIAKSTNVLSFPRKLRYITMTPFSVKPDEVLLNEQQMCVSYSEITDGAPCETDDDTSENRFFFTSDSIFDSNTYDKDGYNAEGYHAFGYDRMGWTKDGFFRDSFNRDGFDVLGFDRNGYNRYGFDRNGCNINGYCLNNSSETILTELHALNSFNSLGYNILGLDYFGFDAYGFNTVGYDRKNCSFFKNGPFYPLFMKQANQQLKLLSNTELQNIKRMCPQNSVIDYWWISLYWLNGKNKAESKFHEKLWLDRRPFEDRKILTLKDIYNGWLASTPDERFCFSLNHFSKCPLNKLPVPCPLQDCKTPICPLKSTAICRNFGCASCDFSYFDVILQKPVSCEISKCIAPDGKEYKELETWQEDPCKQCTCEGGHISCVMIECKEVCHHPIRSSETCCPICDGCEYEGSTYVNGAKFMPAGNPCLQCNCTSGTVHCSAVTCPAMRPCKKDALVVLPGTCCPVCSMCGPHLNGSQWMESPCHNCECRDGKVHCFSVDCPLLICLHPWRPLGECCRRCDSCEYKGKIFKNGEMFKHENCTECECQDGSMICQRIKCPVLECTEPKKLPGSCCPVCEEACQYDGQKYNNGEVFVPKFNPCMNCSCTNSIVRCLPISCPEVDQQCRNPIVLPGSCCPSCMKCVNGSKTYEHGEKWKSSNDPCDSCICTNGIIMCSKVDTCEKVCSHGIIRPDECCSPCIDCIYDGRPVMNHMQFSPPNDPCTRCTCQWGKINCLRESCPRLLCRKTELPTGACCPICKGCIGIGGQQLDHGSQWIHPSDVCQVCSCYEGISRCERVVCSVQCTYPIKKVDSCCPDCNGCQIEGKMYENGLNVPSKDVCSKCRCYNGNIECESIACQAVTCQHPKTVPGRCCPICDNCDFRGQQYANGQIFAHYSDPCFNCSCEMGVVSCENIMKFCNPQCTHPVKINGQCCPVCDGCDYKGNHRKNGEKFPADPMDPCRFCECQHGNVLCSNHECPEVRCKNPVRLAGECCSVCPAYCLDEENGSYHEEGESWTDEKNPCQVCQCLNAMVTCNQVACPPVPCSHPSIQYGECCPSCSDCTFTRKPYSNGQEFTHVEDPCQLCKCQAGNVSCVTVICDPVSCSNPQRVDGHCCPICTADLGCNYLGRFYEPWESFLDPVDACTECVCIDGVVNCHQSTCVEADCPNPLSGHCCSSCNGCSYGEKNYMSDLFFDDPYNACRQCYCETGHVSCQPKTCPPVTCQHPVMPEDGGCCPICKDCFYGGQFFENGELFADPQNSCLECFCEYPLIQCQPRSCPDVNCESATSDGCCETCSDCVLDGTVYADGSYFYDKKDACKSCVCQSGNILCTEKVCSDVTCTHPVKTGCCQECQSDCWLNGSLYTNWQVFPHPSQHCKECTCKSGSISCKPKQCPPAECKHPSIKECCSECSDCMYKGEYIPNGESINHDGFDYCQDCTCIDGNVTCELKQCPVVHCTHPIIDNCCKSCDLGCLYESSFYPPRMLFDAADNPCSECLCLDGSVQCDLKSCDDIACADEAVSKGQCCLHCITSCIHNGDEYENGAIFPHFNDTCQTCQCLDGNVECSEKQCPPAECLHPIFTDCCLVCEDCDFLGKQYANSQYWKNPSDICQTCQCKNGTVQCGKTQCPDSNCTYPTLEDCCPKCHNCEISGEVYLNGEEFDDQNKPCEYCRCEKGEIFCQRRVCPKCLHPVLNPSSCCPECDACMYDENKYDNMEEFMPEENPCLKCICENGNVSCLQLPCSRPNCSKPVNIKGECCPKCLGCLISGIRFEENYSFTHPENPCEDCLCKGGEPICNKRECPLNCSHPLPGPCCPLCDGCLFETITYANQQKFNPDKCRSCQCKDGNVLCVSEICPKLECSLKMLVPGECCETCRGCVYEGTEYVSGDSWISSTNPCLTCSCVGGSITCSDIQCVTPCAKPRPVPGKCCPVCPECEVDGKIYQSGEVFIDQNNPCKTCSCSLGEVTCVTLKCPTLLDCPEESMRPPVPGECCPTCAGLASSCTREQIGRLNYPTNDPCFVCQCTEDYMWTCSKEICPKFHCPDNQVLRARNECCPKCKVCMSGPEDQIHLHGSSWLSPLDSCINCTCDYGSIACVPFTCPLLQCNPGEIIRKQPGVCCATCIIPDDLECHYGDTIYRNEEKYTPDPCTVCQCIGGKMICQNQRCLPLTCPSDEILSVDPGKCCPKCIPRPASCIAFGDPHYRTFDGAIVDFQGTCRYILAADCYTQLFSVIVENADRGLKGVSWTERVVLVLKNATVDLRKGPTVYVKGKPLKHLPYLDDPVLYIENTGTSVLVTTNVGVKVLWNGDSFVEVTVSGTFRAKTCGLCGNFNNFPEDDIQMPTGEVVQSDAKFGNSWKNRGAQTKQCEDAVDLDPCNEGGYRARKNANVKCSVLKSSMFASCHQFIPPEPYFAACVYDMCACSENDDCLCNILSSYSHQCAKAGVVLNWRSAGFCDIGCSEEEGLVFDECGPPCPRTCENRDMSTRILAAQCFKPCVPGCQCSADKVLHNGRCIPPKNCP